MTKTNDSNYSYHYRIYSELMCLRFADFDFAVAFVDDFYADLNKIVKLS